MKKEETEKKPKLNHPPKLQVPVETCEEHYRQININSFKQNFKLLIGHYKEH